MINTYSKTVEKRHWAMNLANFVMYYARKLPCKSKLFWLSGSQEKFT
jgi:hypothetical protein